MKRLRKHILLLIVLIFFSHCLFSQNDNYASRSFTIPTLDGKCKLSAIFNFPLVKTDNHTCLILVLPPFANDRHYFGMFDALTDYLCSRGFTICRFNNRNYKYKEYGMRMPVYIQAADAAAAYNAVKKDTRFSKMKIGFLGHSEGCSAIAIAVADTIKADFCILLSPAGVNGDIIAHDQGEEVINLFFKLFPDSTKRELLDIRNKVNDIYAKENDTIYANKRATEVLDSFFKTNSKKVVISNVIINHIIDSFNNKMLQDSLSAKHFAKLEHKDSSISIDLSSILKTDLWQKSLSFLKYEPAKYFPKIKCPLLIVYGKEDKLLIPQKNLDNLQSILNNSNNHYYKAIILDSVGHGFRIPPTLESIKLRNAVPSSNPLFINFNISDKLINVISNWVKYDYPNYNKSFKQAN